MGHSIQAIGDRHIILQDCDILLVLGIMLDLLESDREEYQVLNKMKSLWKSTRKGYGPGVIDLKLETIASDPVLKMAFTLLMSDTKRRVNDYDGVIPKTVANDKFRVQGIKFSDYSTSRLIDVIDMILSILP